MCFQSSCCNCRHKENYKGMQPHCDALYAKAEPVMAKTSKHFAPLYYIMEGSFRRHVLSVLPHEIQPK